MIATLEHPSTEPAQKSPDEKIGELQKIVSANRLNTYLGCRLKFYFRYVEERTKPKSASLHVGGTVHTVLKAWNMARWQDKPLTLDQLHTAFVAAWNDGENPVEWEDEGEQVEQQNSAWRLLETYIRSHPDAQKPEAVEVPVEAEIDGLPKIVGVLDLVEGGRIKDYKTSSTTPNPEKVAHTLEIQTSIYSVLYRENTGRQEKGIDLIHLVKLKREPKVVTTSLPPMSERQESRLHSLIEGYVEGLKRRDFLPSPTMQCSFCEYFRECRAWH